MKILATSMLALSGALLAAAPAAAQRFDAFDSFDGTQGGAPGAANRFLYGEIDPANLGAQGTVFANQGPCAIGGTTCLQLEPNNVPGFYKSTVVGEQGTVNIPNDRLLGHPDDDTGLTTVLFIAPTAGTYRFDASFNVQDDFPSGVDIFRIGTTGGGLPFTSQLIGAIGSGNRVFSFTFFETLGEGGGSGFALGNQGDFRFDSTGINFSAAAVPEPATWAMMIGGVGLVGGAMRRRTARRTTVRFA